MLGLTNYIGSAGERSGPYFMGVCADPDSLGDLCVAGFARSARNMSGSLAMESVCSAQQPERFQSCIDLAERPLPVEYRTSVGLTNINKELTLSQKLAQK